MDTKFIVSVLHILIIVSCVPQHAAITPPAITILPPSNTPFPSPTSTRVVIATDAGPREGDSKVENGFAYVYTVIRSKDSKEPTYSGWFRSVGDFPLLDLVGYVSNGAGGWQDAQNIGPIQVVCEEGVTGADAIRALAHTEINGNYQYMGILVPQISKRFLGVLPPGAGKESQQYNDQWQQLLADLHDGKTDTGYITIKNLGVDYQWAPGPKNGTVVYLMNWNTLPSENVNGFGSSWSDETRTDNFRSAFWGIDEDGNMLSAIASEKSISELSDKQIREMALYHSIKALYNTDISVSGFDSHAELFARLAGQDATPHIVIKK